MAYSKAYQEVIAGRVREDEQIGMFRNNQVATPARVTGFYPVGANEEVPGSIRVYHFRDPNIAKPNTEKDPEKAAYDAGSYNVD